MLTIMAWLNPWELYIPLANFYYVRFLCAHMCSTLRFDQSQTLYTPCFMLEQYILHASCLSSIYIYTLCFMLEQYIYIILYASCLSSIILYSMLEQYILHSSCLSSNYTPCFMLEQYILHTSCLSSIYSILHA